MNVVDEIITMFKTRGHEAYVGEAVSQKEHALQSALLAESEMAPAPLITAALLHDIGHLITKLPEDCAQQGIDDKHEDLGWAWLRKHFGDDVTQPIRLHVDAKRFLCAREPGYHEGLSDASKLSLSLQGGPFAEDQAREFIDRPHAADAVRLRHWDDEAKIPGLPTPDLDHFRGYIEASLR